ncbi:hypothetical protein [Streptomyces sp. NPDC057509]
MRPLPLESTGLRFGGVRVLVAAALPLCGWVEDIAAGRRSRLLP